VTFSISHFASTQMRHGALSSVLLLLPLAAACTPRDGSLTGAERRAIADTLEGLVRRAYDLSAPSVGAVDRLINLYADTGRVVSASGGRILTSRDSLADGIRYFWESTGRNMREPRWVWEQMVTDVLTPDAAVLTATYRVPHRTPRGEPHELAGAMTLVFARRGGRWVVVQEHLSDRPPEASMPAMPNDPARAPQ
jgi:ketosteroid isomerase-like protein